MLKIKNKIEDIGNLCLIEHFKDAVMDNNYNPSSEPYNKSVFTLEELEQEVLRRVDNSKTQFYTYE
jgi:hypothetical protein